MLCTPPVLHSSVCDATSSFHTGAPLSGLWLLYCILHSIPPLPLLEHLSAHWCYCVWIVAPRFLSANYLPFHMSSVGELRNSHGRSLVWIVAAILNSELPTPPTFGAPQSPSVLLWLDCHCSIMFCKLYTIPHLLRLWALQLPSAHLSLDCHCNIEFCTLVSPFRSSCTGMEVSSIPVRAPQSRVGAPIFLVVAPIFHPNVAYCLWNTDLDSQLANISLNLC